MHMFRPFAWISESKTCDEVLNGEADYKLASATIPVMEIIPGGGATKRKRDDNILEVTTEGLPEAKRIRTDVDAKSAMEEESTAADSDRVCEAIEAQFGLEILLKHDELRLINQELAKCQVALEQLRRCHLIPYPTSQGTSEAMVNISNGSGPSLRQGNHVPQWAAPYGVTDGPYTRHYAKWLIPDPSFDGEQYEWQQSVSAGSRASKTLVEGRSTRHSIAEASTPLSANRGRGQRGSTGQKLQALSSGYPGAKATGPSYVKRKDGQLVKLVCNNCKREDFSSTQGFINHVRIAHKIEYKSHEEAAIACGQPVETDEIGGRNEVQTPATANGLVHPLIRTAPTDREAYVSLLSHIRKSLSLFEQGKLPGVSSIPGSASSSPVRKQHLKSTSKATTHQSFVPSSDAPHLSAFMQNKGFGLNLTEMVGEAKQPVDFDDISSHDEDSESEKPVPQRHLGGLDRAGSPLPAMRVPARSAAPLGRPGSSKSIEGVHAMRKPGISPRMAYATPFIDTVTAASHNKPSTRLVNSHEFDSHQDIDGDVDMVGPSLIDLSPNTVASNIAPSLVSDDGEYDDGDDAESQPSEDEEEGSDVAEIDIEDGEVKVLPGVRSSAAGGRKEDKHVTFVSPVKGKKERHARA